MRSSRPIQYLALAALVLVSLAIIFFPVGESPTAQDYTLRLAATKPWQELVGSTKNVTEEADKALVAEFKTDKMPGALIVPAMAGKAPAAGASVATIDDQATTREEALTRARRIESALGKVFRGAKLDPASLEELSELPPQPLLQLGKYAVFPIQQKNGSIFPAVKLGLDLRGGVNLVLQVRRALFTYRFERQLGADTEARDRFATEVRNALATAPESLGLKDANLSFAEDQPNTIQIRAQAKNREQFAEQRKAILAALMAQLGSAKFTEAREPQFFEPSESVGQSLGTEDYSGVLLDRTVEIIRSRVDRLGVSEPLIQKQLPNRIIVQLPGVNDPQKAVDVIGKTAQLEIRLLPADLKYEEREKGNLVFFDAQGREVPSAEVRQRSELIISGDHVKPTTTVDYTETREPAVLFQLQGEGTRRFGEATTKNVNRFMPIFLDERCISAPSINEPITGGSGQISGGFKDIEEARELASLLNSGALPAPIDVVENRTVSATLGNDSLIKSLRAGAIGILAVAVFMVVWYRLPGMLANAALAIYFVLNLAVFVLLGGTLTLPGIAGFLLAVAMSLDTNILVFERLKEEMAVQPTFAAALRAAFSRAWTAILDSHVTTLIAALVLFYLGTGPVKGFALTLGIGVLLSLFSAISVTRLFMWSVAHIGEKNRSLFAGAVARAPAMTAGRPAAR